MRPESHEDGGAIGAQGGSTAGPLAGPRSSDEALQFSRRLPYASGAAALAFFAYAANQAVAQQVSLAHLYGTLAEAQARQWADAGAQALPSGPLRAVVMTAADLQVQAVSELRSIASAWGRRFGHKAFAFPLTGAFDRRAA